jgi:crotonobetainyl-CoA:carnitine CoA-transferase CaiB-like acyl-CoA transferase
MARPLAGVRVLEFANFIAGPFCGMLLGDMGADVIKIEPPRGDLARAIPPMINGESASFAAINRNKKSLVLDLKSAEGRDLALRLAAGADVVVENNRPGVMERLGLDAASIRRVNPAIVYTSVSGFGQTGPDRNRAGVNLIIEAMAGTLSVMGEPGAMPPRPGIQTADMFGALFAAYATLAGLVGAARGGEGRVSDVSLMEASIATAIWETAEYFATGRVPGQLGHSHRSTAPYQLFATAEGRHVAVGVPNDAHFARLMAVLGLGGHLSDPRFASLALRKENEAVLVPLIAAAVAEWTAADFEAAMLREGVPCGPVRNYAEALGNPHIHARGLVVETRHPVLGRMQTVRNAVVMDHDGPQIARPAPVLGQHSREVLASVGISGDDFARLVDAGVTVEAKVETAQLSAAGG